MTRLHKLSGPQSENVLIERVQPSHRVMPRVDLAVTAGGQGSVQCALAGGTPLNSLPLQPEPDWNGQLLESSRFLTTFPPDPSNANA